MKAFLKMIRNYKIMSENRLFEETACLEPCNEVLSLMFANCVYIRICMAYIQYA